MEAHPYLYADTARGPRLAIREGLLELGSVVDARGLGTAVEPDVAAMDAMPEAGPGTAPDQAEVRTRRCDKLEMLEESADALAAEYGSAADCGATGTDSMR